jgi:hypothetical protein
MFNFILDNIHIGIGLYLIIIALLILANKRFWDMIGKDDRGIFSLGSIKTGRLSGTTPNRSNIPKSRDEALDEL